MADRNSGGGKREANCGIFRLFSLHKVAAATLALGSFAASANEPDLSPGTMKDSPVQAAGITLYGTIDTGYVYQTHGAPFSGALATGFEYRAFSAKNLRGPISSLAENGREQSGVGIKMEEALGGGWTAISRLETGFNPLSGEIADNCASLGRNNGVNQLYSNSNSDGSRCGQAFNGEAYGGISSPAYGTLTVGRQDSLDLNLLARYDPMDLAPAFSLLASGGAGPGTGDSETARWDNSVKYILQYGAVHAAALYTTGGPDTPQVNGGYAFNLGGTYGGFSADAVYSRDKGAISSASFNGTSGGPPCPGAGCPSNLLSATITDDRALTIGAKYSFAFESGMKDEAISPSLTFFVGYQYSARANPVPADQAAVLARVNNEPFEPGSERLQKTGWAGAAYAAGPWVFSAAYYHLSQNAFLTNSATAPTCAQQTANNLSTGAIGNKTGSNCAGGYNQASFLVAYFFTKHFDVYGGVSYSEASGGIASGYINTGTTTVLTGLRLRF